MIDSAYERGDYDWVYANHFAHPGMDEFVLKYITQRSWVGAPAIRHALDLCAGTGALTRFLAGCIPKVVAVDKSPAMLDGLVAQGSENIQVVALDLNGYQAYERLQAKLPDAGVDLITCRQGVGYLSGVFLRQVPSLLAPGGSFLFNCFSEPKWARLRRFGRILEAGVYMPRQRRVYHLQIRWPRFDLTTFQWHDPEKLAKMWETVGLEVTVESGHRSRYIEVTRRFQ